jgi:hypothetical protein
LKKATIKRSFGAFAAAAAACLLIPATVFAALHFLSPSQVAQEFKYPVLAEAFESDNALIINETLSDDGYNVTLLGVVSGKGLDEFAEEIDKNKTYAVVAVEKENGEMPATTASDYDSTPFFVSPLIHGQNPWQFNMASMGGGTASFIRDGVMYRLVECDNVEMFADRGLTFIVSSTHFYDINAYTYDEGTGLVTPNPDFDGVNLMFDLPLDTSKADHEKAQEYLDNLWDENTERAEQSPVPEGDVNTELTITDEGSVVKEVMTRETMVAGIETQIEEAQAAIERGDYSESSLALDKNDYDSYLKAIDEGKTVTIFTYDDGGRYVSVSDPEAEASSGISAEENVSSDGVEIIFDELK